MEFFQTLAAMADGYDVTLTVRKNADTSLTISVLPIARVKDQALAHLTPMAFTGTPQAIDEGFFDAIKKSFTTLATLADQAKKFEAELEDRKKKTAAEKDKQTAAELKVKNVKEHLKNWEMMIKDKNYRTCQDMIKKAMKTAEGDEALVSMVTAKQKELNQARGTLTMFDQTK